MDKIWVADLGGTNCRLAEFTLSPNQSLELGAQKKSPSQDLSGEEDLARAFVSAFGTCEALLGVAIALAGPVAEGCGTLTNGRLHLKEAKLSAAFGRPTLLLNDFAAQAYGCLTQAGQKALPVRQGQKAGPILGVLGAGTGLGCAALSQTLGAAEVRPSEAGHSLFPFQADPEEQAYAAFLQRCGLTRPSYEDVLSGRGLESLYAFQTGEHCQAALISKRALQKPSPTLRLFARFYGRFCRHWILSSLCTGGLWLGGGITLANPLCVQSPDFFAELWEERLLWVNQVPVYRFSDDNSGLWGAAQAWLFRKNTA
ncbi:MAG: ROK family protein [Desulfovibrio sp.]|nr:ROK family protein [Desulfovibrio sp.]